MLSEPVPNSTSIIPGSCAGARGARPWERAPAKAAHFVAGSTGAGGAAHTRAIRAPLPAQAGTDPAAA